MNQSDLEKWRSCYRAMMWMVNDYLGVVGIDLVEADHPGFTYARRVERDCKPPAPPRLVRFNDETACLTGGNAHPDRCVCQMKEKGQFAGTPHKHYDEPPYRCARCGCPGYVPAIPQPEVSDLDKKIAWSEGSIASSQIILRWLRANGHDDLARRIMNEDLGPVPDVPDIDEEPQLSYDEIVQMRADFDAWLFKRQKTHPISADVIALLRPWAAKLTD